VAATALL